MVRKLSILAAALALVVAGSCSEPTACTDVGCSDQASFTIRPPGSHWDEGAYSLQVKFDDAVYSCSFTLPDALPGTGSWQALDCTPALQAYLTPEVDCEEHKNGDSVSQVCTPIPDQYYLQASSTGTPATLAVTLQRDDTTLLEETRALSYRATQPNGPECGPTCQQASTDFTWQ
ncbi:MAG TPA: hypothetical protein VHM25_18755 [Polyangiaceae bacterium]|nr:hypothetical protein [Polyangiaceae bacterium]